MKKAELEQLIKEVISEIDTASDQETKLPPRELIKKLQKLLNTTNKIFDFALIITSTHTIGSNAGYDFEFFNSLDDVDYDSLEGFPICKVYRDKVKLI